ncbi:MAG: OsmC family peroxiredoxin [Acidimicrobiia bacterium]
MQSRATATWEGDLSTGAGTVTLATGVATDLPVSWPSRTEAANGKTSPEELIAAAHAACYSMAFSNALAGKGFPPVRLDTSAEATFEKIEPGWRLTKMALSVRGNVPGIGADEFQEVAAAAKDGCPVSNALKGNVEITIQAVLA